MKFINEYRDPFLAHKILDEIKQTTTRPWTIMEVCGGQTHSLVKNGIIDLLPDEINMVHGPGCPVCVTPVELIDQAIYLAKEKGVILCSYGDMVRVPGSDQSLLEAKALGADIRILYSPLEAVKIAGENKDKEVVFFAVGFETTAPANALSVIHAQRLGLKNYAILASHVLVPPAMKAILDDEDHTIQGFLGAGHVCSIMGTSEYYPIAEKYKVPIVITGFEPLDLLQGILMTVKQLEAGISTVENQYSRIVKPEGNSVARETVEKVFENTDRMWRGIGIIPDSGYRVRKEFRDYDAHFKFDFPQPSAIEDTTCIAGQIMRGLKKPIDCINFGKTCNPENPLGAPMVSSEGACAAYYHFANLQTIH